MGSVLGSTGRFERLKGHEVMTYIGVDQREIQKKIRRVVKGDYMAMGKAGMAEMGEMEMPMPDNTLPMMTGFAQFGPLEMGGMFTVVKVREGLAANDYKDPSWFKHPEGTVAHEIEIADAAMPSPARASEASSSATSPRSNARSASSRACGASQRGWR